MGARTPQSLVRFQAGAPFYLFALAFSFFRSYFAASLSISFLGTAISFRVRSRKRSNSSELVSRFGDAFFIGKILACQFRVCQPLARDHSGNLNKSLGIVGFSVVESE